MVPCCIYSKSRICKQVVAPFVFVEVIKPTLKGIKIREQKFKASLSVLHILELHTHNSLAASVYALVVSNIRRISIQIQPQRQVSFGSGADSMVMGQ